MELLHTSHFHLGLLLILIHLLGVAKYGRRMCRVGTSRGYVVGPCHHGMARPQVAERGTASDKEGSCE